MTTYQELMEESNKLHKDSLAQLESTLGGYHHRVADLCHKVAGHCILREEHELAQYVDLPTVKGRLQQTRSLHLGRSYLDRALRIWGTRSWYKNQVARTSFLKGTHLLSLGGEAASEGKRWIEQAAALRKEILPNCDMSKASEKDYDELVVFWSR